MPKCQPGPYEVKRGKLVDAIGQEVNFNNVENLKAIAKAMSESIEMVLLEEELDETKAALEEAERDARREEEEKDMLALEIMEIEEELKKLKDGIKEIEKKAHDLT